MLKDLFPKIESAAFAARINLASGYSQFLKILAIQPESTELLSRVHHLDQAEACLRQALRCSRMTVDTRFENRFDVALATYIWVLYRCHPDLATIAAISCESSYACWWSRHLAREVLAQATSQAVPTKVQVLRSGATVRHEGGERVYSMTPTRPGDLPVEDQVIRAPVYQTSDLIVRPAARVETVKSYSKFGTLTGRVPGFISMSQAACAWSALRK
jgi:hypothetical protein